MSNTIKKNQKAKIPTKNGNDYSYQYVDIAQIHGYLEANNMSYYQYIDTVNGNDYIMTVKIINGEEKPALRGARIVDATLYGNDNPAQKQGSAITYARRYSLLMAFGLATEDDEANSLNKFAEPKEATEESAKNWKFPYGKYKGETMESILDEDTQYVEWYINNKANEYDKKCYELLTGEKLPTEEEQDERIKTINSINNLVLDTDTDYEELYKYFKIKSLNELTIAKLKECKQILEKKMSKKND